MTQKYFCLSHFSIFHFQITPSRPLERSRMSKRLKTVSRTYGGSRCHRCVRERYVEYVLVLWFLGSSSFHHYLVPCVQMNNSSKLRVNDTIDCLKSKFPIATPIHFNSGHIAGKKRQMTPQLCWIDRQQITIVSYSSGF